MTRSRSRRTMALVAATMLAASALALRPAAAAAQPLPRLPKMVWELYLQEEYNGCGVMYGLYAQLPEADRAKLHAGTKIPLDAGTLTRGQTGVLAAWFNSARWGCDPPPEKLDANAVRSATIVLKCDDGVVEFCLQSPEQGIWKKLTIACAPERAEWVRDGLPLLPFWYTGGWEGGTMPPVPTPPSKGYLRDSLATLGWERFHWPWYTWRDLYSAYANLPADILRELHQGTDVSLPLAKLPGPVRDGIVAGLDRQLAADNRGNGWPEETLRTPEMRRQCFGIATVDFTYRRAHPDYRYGEASMHSVPRPHRTVFMQLHWSPWAVRERVRVYSEVTEEPLTLAKYSPIWRVAVPAAVQRRFCEWAKERTEWSDKWMEEIPGDPRAKRAKPGAPPCPEPWP